MENPLLLARVPSGAVPVASAYSSPSLCTAIYKKNIYSFSSSSLEVPYLKWFVHAAHSLAWGACQCCCGGNFEASKLCSAVSWENHHHCQCRSYHNISPVIGFHSRCDCSTNRGVALTISNEDVVKSEQTLLDHGQWDDMPHPPPLVMTGLIPGDPHWVSTPLMPLAALGTDSLKAVLQ